MTTTLDELPYGWELEKIITEPMAGDYDPEGQPFPLPTNNLYCIVRQMYHGDMYEYVQIQVPKKLTGRAVYDYIIAELRRGK